MIKNLNNIALKLSDNPKGILAADESTNTITKRFSDIKLESNFENRRKYRELLFTSENLNKFISGVILYDETIKQSTSDGISFSKYLTDQDIIPGIKVDTGAIPIEPNSEEKITEGLDNLGKRLIEYKKLGASFTKWRAIINIDKSKKIPTNYSIELNSYNLARYAKIVQENEMVPIVEPEILMDGSHSIDECFEATSKTQKILFEKLDLHSVDLSGIILKPNMIISGKKCTDQANVNKVASMTLRCLEENVPKEVPGIMFLSGGQSNEIATEHLNEINKLSSNNSWNLSFSYGRALQQPCLNAWRGKDENISDSQKALIKRSRLNSFATKGEYVVDLEKS